MNIKEWIAAGGIIFSIVAAGISYGRMASGLEDAQTEIRLLREDMRAINSHFISWAASHQER